MVGGHEGGGVIEAVGVGVSRVKVGDHVITTFIPSCGKCRFCASGRTTLCDNGAALLDGELPSGGYRFHADGQDFGGLNFLGCFSQYSTIPENSCVVVDQDLPLGTVALLACGVPTGWGSAVYAGDVKPGDTTVVYGVGGIGGYAVQGAAYAGAINVVAVDPNPFKQEKSLEWGATHAVATLEEAKDLVTELTRGVGADQALVTMDVAEASVVAAAFYNTSKGGTLVLTSAAAPDKKTLAEIGGFDLTMWNRRIQGTLYGSTNPFDEIPRLASLYRAGHLKLDETITRRYKLDEVNQGYADLIAGKNIRGVIDHVH
jgi:S-(hydroxymethyl)glutathione dehydrogenase/alcohol dehydrogenase